MMKPHKANIFATYRNIKITCYDLLAVGSHLHVSVTGNTEIYLQEMI